MRFRFKILLCLIILLSLSLGVSGSWIIDLSFRDALDREQDSALNAYQMTASALELTGQTDPEPLGQVLGRIQELAGWDCVQLTRDGEVIYRLGRVFASSEDVNNAMPGMCCARLFSLEGGGTYIQLSGVIDLRSETMELTLVRDVTTIYEVRDNLLRIYHTVFLFTVLLGGAVGWLLALVLTGPLRQISIAARRMAKGDLSVRLKTRSNDEMGHLSRNFNHMAAQLEENVHSLEETMAAQERFMGSFAHELKTPMTSIIGYADLLRTQSLPQDEAREAANYIFSESKRLERLSIKLLELLVAKNKTPLLQEVSVDRQIYALAKHLRPIYREKGIVLECRCQPVKCPMDAELFQSVLMNLLENSRKAIEQGGLILIMADTTETDCRIQICDNGRGMPPEAIRHITEAFYRVDKSRSRARGNAGLGLTLCDEIIRLHDGSMTFDSTPGKGTCVTITLPLTAKGGTT